MATIQPWKEGGVWRAMTLGEANLERCFLKLHLRGGEIAQGQKGWWVFVNVINFRKNSSYIAMPIYWSVFFSNTIEMWLREPTSQRHTLACAQWEYMSRGHQKLLGLRIPLLRVSAREGTVFPLLEEFQLEEKNTWIMNLSANIVI